MAKGAKEDRDIKIQNIRGCETRATLLTSRQQSVNKGEKFAGNQGRPGSTVVELASWKSVTTKRCPVQGAVVEVCGVGVPLP